MTTWEPYARLPKGIVRDLLAITRLLYRHTIEQDPHDVVRLQQLEDIGTAYRKALKLCANPEHRGTNPYFDGWGDRREGYEGVVRDARERRAPCRGSKGSSVQDQNAPWISGNFGTG